MKTIEQERAADALARVAELSGRSPGFKKSYRAYVDRMGPAIVMNGLGQALATELAAAGPKPEKPGRGVGLVGMAQKVLPGNLPEERGGSGVNRPLYAAAAVEPAHREPAGHAGLWFDKFCNTWRRDGGAWKMTEDKERRERGADGNPKLEWLRTLVDGPVGAEEQIDEYALRIVRLVERRGGLAVVFNTEARFVTGLGRSHPVENGFAWHPTLGTPCLPGSSVKGMVRAWVDAAPDPRPGAGETRDRLLGTPGRAGRLCFLDAVPTVPVRLDADVMTPHFAGWSAEHPPGDWRTPTPIPFLVTAAETRFLFSVLPVQPLGDGDLSTVETWLRDALAWAGAGAKTAVGYGRFGRDDEETARWKRRVGDEDRRRKEERERHEAMRTPEGRWRLELQGLSEAEVLDQVRVHLEKEPLADARDRRAFANAVRSMDFVGHWRNGRTRDPRTGVGKKKLKERVRLLDDAARERELG